MCVCCLKLNKASERYIFKDRNDWGLSYEQIGSTKHIALKLKGIHQFRESTHYVWVSGQ